MDYAENYIGRHNRATFRQEFAISGHGVHSGKRVNLRFIPAPAETGLVFRNTRAGSGEVKVSPFSVVDKRQAVTLGNDKWRIGTVEHLLFALQVAGISDGYLEVDGAEAPILDGSAHPFYEAIISNGIDDLGVALEPITITNPIWEIQGDRYVIALPHDGFRISSTISYDHPLLQGSFLALDLNSEVCANELASARTFGFLKDVEALKAKGLALGASIDNAVVLTDESFLNDSLRFNDECARHKMLDIIGDLSLIGRPLKAHIIASRTGHSLNAELGLKILRAVIGNEIGSKRELTSLSASFPANYR